ncbi:hypothetical protein FB451DRAFT_1242645 [Mycena latifolia]|nr:hypothetical protein FB451DRAFT_1242645 [Mycena latifolia]
MLDVCFVLVVGGEMGLMASRSTAKPKTMPRVIQAVLLIALFKTAGGAVLNHNWLARLPWEQQRGRHQFPLNICTWDLLGTRVH